MAVFDRYARFAPRHVPLGFISLTENLMMMGMGSWMLFSL